MKNIVKLIEPHLAYQLCHLEMLYFPQFFLTILDRIPQLERSLVSTGHLSDLSVLFVRIQKPLFVILCESCKYLNVAEKTSQKRRHIETAFEDTIIL